jgi:hypothetical protein
MEYIEQKRREDRVRMEEYYRQLDAENECCHYEAAKRSVSVACPTGHSNRKMLGLLRFTSFHSQ